MPESDAKAADAVRRLGGARCSNCVFFRLWEVSHREGPWEGSCVRYPRMVVAEGQTGDVVYKFSRTRKQDWCGEYAAGEEQDKAKDGTI